MNLFVDYLIVIHIRRFFDRDECIHYLFVNK